MNYLAMVAVVFGVNLLPAFGPPTWSVLAVYGLHGHMAPVALVGLGACAAASGRLILALACRRLSNRLSAAMAANLAGAREFLTGNRRRSLIGLQSPMKEEVTYWGRPSRSLPEGTQPERRLGHGSRPR